MSDYDETNAESIIHVKGRPVVLVHKDQLTRAEKDVLRNALMDPDSNVLAQGDSYLLELPKDAPQGDDTEDEQLSESELSRLDDLERMTVPALKDLADTKGIDLTGVTLKADIVNKIAAYYEDND